MKMSGAALSRSGSIDSFGVPPPGTEMLSAPPATMQSAPSERMLFAAIAMVCSPDEQKRFTDTPAVVLDGVGRHRHRWGNIEPAAPGFCQPGAGIRNNNGFTHFFLPLRWPIMARKKL